MSSSNILHLGDIQIFRDKISGKFFAAIAYGCEDSPDYILDLHINERVPRSDAAHVTTYWTIEQAEEFHRNLVMNLSGRTTYGNEFEHRLHTLFSNYDISPTECFISVDDEFDDYDEEATGGGDIIGTFEFVKPCPSDGESIRIGISRDYEWVHIGYTLRAGNKTAFQCAIDLANSLNVKATDAVISKLESPVNPTISEEKATMQGAIQKGSEIAAGLMQTNKEGISIVAQLTSGGTALQIAINRIEQFIPVDKREQFKHYANTPLGKLAVANLLSVAQAQFMPASDKAKYIATGAVISAMNEVAQALPIQQIVIDLFSGINIPEIQG